MRALRIEHPVPDFDAWKQAFDRDPLDREGSGVRRYRVLRPVDDPGYAIVDLEFDDADDADAMRAALEEMWRRVQAEGLIGDQVARVYEIVETVEYRGRFRAAATREAGVAPAEISPGDQDRLLTAILNLAAFHRDHEKFYASAPREQAVTMQRHARTLLALADRWSVTAPDVPEAFSPFEGAEDLNDPVATQLDGVLFMEGEDEPAELGRIRRELRAVADETLATGEWLNAAMAASWNVAEAILGIPELAGSLGDRHRIIANDWQAASMSVLAGQLLARALEILDRVDFSPAALRADLASDAIAPRRLYSASELIAHAADLLSDSAGLVHDNEARWRRFRTRVQELTGPR